MCIRDRDPSLKCWRVRDQFAADAQRLVDTINGGADAQVVAAFRVIFAKVPTELRDRVHRALVKALHPDAGGDEAAMKALGVYEDVKGKLVLGENVAQAAQFVQSGAADAGIVALPLALAPHMRSSGRHVEIPVASYPRMDQGGLVLKGAREPAAARILRDALLGLRGREILKEGGFFPPAPISARVWAPVSAPVAP